MITKFKQFINENEGGAVAASGTAFATLSNTGGMGNVVAPQPGAVPGSYGTVGSGDIANGSLGTYFKPTIKYKKKRKTKKSKSKLNG